MGSITAPDGAASFMAPAVAELFGTAAGHEHAGRLDDAEWVLKLVLDAEPNQPDAPHLLGVVAARRRR